MKIVLATFTCEAPDYDADSMICQIDATTVSCSCDDDPTPREEIRFGTTGPTLPIEGGTPFVHGDCVAENTWEFTVTLDSGLTIPYLDQEQFETIECLP